MKKVEAVIREEQLAVVRAALEEVGYAGLTISAVRGHGRQRGVKQVYRGKEFMVDLLPKVKLEMLVGDADVTKIVQTIVETARTGAVGDGKIWVTSVETVVRVRTGESGEVAL
jgi:nitrogen regulatory protein P-II 1